MMGRVRVVRVGEGVRSRRLGTVSCYPSINTGDVMQTRHADRFIERAVRTLTTLTTLTLARTRPWALRRERPVEARVPVHIPGGWRPATPHASGTANHRGAGPRANRSSLKGAAHAPVRNPHRRA